MAGSSANTNEDVPWDTYVNFDSTTPVNQPSTYSMQASSTGAWNMPTLTATVQEGDVEAQKAPETGAYESPGRDGLGPVHVPFAWMYQTDQEQLQAQRAPETGAGSQFDTSGHNGLLGRLLQDQRQYFMHGSMTAAQSQLPFPEDQARQPLQQDVTTLPSTALVVPQIPSDLTQLQIQKALSTVQWRPMSAPVTLSPKPKPGRKAIKENQDATTLPPTAPAVPQTSDAEQKYNVYRTTGGVPITRSDVHMGPMSAPVTLRPRPRPGRKPIQENKDDRETRRKAQNRKAQRAFRSRKDLLAEELAKQVQDMKTATQAKEMKIRREAAEKDKRIAHLEAENARLQREAAASMEMDFTLAFKPSRADPCGFCNDEGNCACSTTHQPPPTQPLRPGTCDACQADPVRAAACRELAGEADGVPEQGPYPTDTMSCNQFIDRVVATGGKMGDVSNLFAYPNAGLRAYPRTDGLGYDLAEHDAAAALASLSGRHDSGASASSYNSATSFNSSVAGPFNTTASFPNSAASSYASAGSSNNSAAGAYHNAASTLSGAASFDSSAASSNNNTDSYFNGVPRTYTHGHGHPTG